MSDISSKDVMEQAKKNVDVKQAAIRVLERKEVDYTFQSVAECEARLKSYNTVYKRYASWIRRQALLLMQNKIIDENVKINTARLIAHWETKEQEFLLAREEVLKQAGPKLKQRLITSEFDDLPEDVRNQLLDEFEQKKLEVFHWFTQRIRAAYLKSKK